MSNKTIGNKVEYIVAYLFQKQGYWVHLLAQTQQGQPCDMVALRGNTSFLIDAKHCLGTRFFLRRIEPNQINAFRYATSLGIKCAFVIVHGDTAHWFPWDMADTALKEQRSSIDIEKELPVKWKL